MCKINMYTSIHNTHILGAQDKQINKMLSDGTSWSPYYSTVCCRKFRRQKIKKSQHTVSSFIRTSEAKLLSYCNCAALGMIYSPVRDWFTLPYAYFVVFSFPNHCFSIRESSYLQVEPLHLDCMQSFLKKILTSQIWLRYEAVGVSTDVYFHLLVPSLFIFISFNAKRILMFSLRGRKQTL